MLIALAFAHFSSELLLKEQMIIPVKKRLTTLVISMQNWLILAKFAKKIQRNRLFFTDCFLANSLPPPRNFLWNQPILLIICPWKNVSKFEFFPLKSTKSADFLRILTFLPRKSCQIGWFFREFWLFSRQNPTKLAEFSANLPLKIPQNFAFFPRNIRSPAC